MIDKKIKDIIGKKVFYVEAEDNSKQESRLIGFYLEDNGYLKAVCTNAKKEMHIDLINVSEDEAYIDKRIEELLPTLNKAKELHEKYMSEIRVKEDERDELVKPVNDEIMAIQDKANKEIEEYREQIIGKSFLEIAIQ